MSCRAGNPPRRPPCRALVPKACPEARAANARSCLRRRFGPSSAAPPRGVVARRYCRRGAKPAETIAAAARVPPFDAKTSAASRSFRRRTARLARRKSCRPYIQPPLLLRLTPSGALGAGRTCASAPAPQLVARSATPLPRGAGSAGAGAEVEATEASPFVGTSEDGLEQRDGGLSPRACFVRKRHLALAIQVSSRDSGRRRRGSAGFFRRHRRRRRSWLPAAPPRAPPRAALALVREPVLDHSAQREVGHHPQRFRPPRSAAGARATASAPTAEMPAGVAAGSRITHSVIGHRRRGAFLVQPLGRRTGSGRAPRGGGTTPASARRARASCRRSGPNGRASNVRETRSSLVLGTPRSRRLGVDAGFGVPIPTSATSAFAVRAPTATTRGVRVRIRTRAIDLSPSATSRVRRRERRPLDTSGRRGAS